MAKKPLKKNKSIKSDVKVVYETFEVSLMSTDSPMTSDVAKQLLGWTEEGDKEDFKNEYQLRTSSGKKVRLKHTLTNRSFNETLAGDWMLEILRGKWRMNGETIKIDRTGMVQDGQHRLAGVVLAKLEWEEDSKRKPDERKWTNWESEPTFETLLVTGISEDDDVVNTIGTGRPRNLSDVLFRSRYFLDVPSKDRIGLAKAAAGAIKTLWYATKADETSFAPRRPHSESLDFLNRHEKILHFVRKIYAERESLQSDLRVPVPYAAGLAYLMAASGTDIETYEKAHSEEGIDWSLQTKCEKFWEELSLANGTLKILAETLRDLPSKFDGLAYRDAILATISKAWAAYSDGRPVTAKTLTLVTYQDEFGRTAVDDKPNFGGIHLID